MGPRTGGLPDRPTQTVGAQIELPGMWFSDKEIHALLTMQHLLANLDPAASSRPTSPHCSSALTPSWGATRQPADGVRKRVLIVGIGKRSAKLTHFRSHRRRPAAAQTPDHPLLRARQGARANARSPQRLVHRENWYLDAWCHLRSQVRNFAVDSIRRVQLLKTPPTTSRTPASTPSWVPATTSSPVPPSTTARLRFSPERARWVAAEHWHPDQHGSFDADGPPA